MGAALAIAMVVVLAHMAWLTNISSLVVDLMPKSAVGTAFGVVAAGSALGGILMNQAVGYLVTYYSYTWCFVAMAFLHPAAWLLLWALGIGRDRRANLESVSPEVSESKLC
jgi:ACS family hexuronate transporter-like MFS transporter